MTSNIPRVILPDTTTIVDEPRQLSPARSPTARLLGAGRGAGLLALPPPRARSPPIYLPLTSTSDRSNAKDNPRKWTQEDQNDTDEKARKKAMNELVASWMDRLQLISVITTFFAAMEAELLGTTAPDDHEHDSLVSQLANATLAGALVVHVFAAILSFLAAFFLIRYKLTIAKREERKVESGLASGAAGSVDLPNGGGSASGDATRTTTSGSMQPIWSSDPHLEQVGPFRRGQPPTHLLDHCHSLCMWLSVAGFVLALTGVLSLAWSRLAMSGGIFASACMAICLVSSVTAVFWPASSSHQ